MKTTKNAPAYLTFLREAREGAQRDRENFEILIHAFERIGAMERGQLEGGLGKYERQILDIAAVSPLSGELPTRFPNFHISANSLFTLVRNQRNSAMHQGAVARTLVRHSIELCLILEHALAYSADMTKASDYMVREICYALLDQPISYIRQRMLENSFSYLPVANTFELLSDTALARWLRTMSLADQRRALACPLRDAIAHEKSLPLLKTQSFPANIAIAILLEQIGHTPVLLHDDADQSRIVGLISGFDLL